MEILDKIKSDTNLADKIYDICDIELYDMMRKPENLNDQMIWNINGLAFGQDASGGEFVLLDDNTIGFNSSEGETGRIAENMTALFSLLVNCPCFHDFLVLDLYKDDVLLKKYADRMSEEYRSDYNELNEYDYDLVKAEIAQSLGFTLEGDISKTTLREFYKTATREPQYMYTYRKPDGSEIISDTFISRPMMPWMRERLSLD